jgi:hypothetical protein
VAQYKVRRGSVEGCGVAQLRMRHGSVDRVRRGSVSVRSVSQFSLRHDSVQGAARLISACGVAQLGRGVNQYRVRCGSIEDGAWLSKGGVWLSMGAAWLSRVQRG